MKRKAYLTPECRMIPYCTHDCLMGIGGSTGALRPFGKDTDFEEDDYDENLSGKDIPNDAVNPWFHKFENGDWKKL